MTADLREYARKRDLDRTPEPGPGAPDRQLRLPKGASGRFVIQEHHARSHHYDLRLEQDGVLKSWAVPRGIPTKTGARRLAIETEDHPLQYLDFEGQIPPGSYGAGMVRIHDRGLWAQTRSRPGRLIFLLVGERIKGEYVLVRTGSGSWLLFLRRSLLQDDARALPESHSGEDTARPGHGDRS